MATLTLGVATPDTGVTPNTSGAFTPASNDLLLVFTSTTASIISAPTLTSSIGGFTFTRFNQQSFRTDLDTHQVWVADALVSDTSSQTVTWSESGDEGTGSNITVIRVSGMSVAGVSAIQQSKTVSGGAAATPETVFDGGATSSSNPVISVIACGTNPPAVTLPSGFSELSNISHASPDHGQQTAFVNSGHSSATITWGSVVGSSFGMISVELDAPAGGVIVPVLVSQYRSRRA